MFEVKPDYEEFVSTASRVLRSYDRNNLVNLLGQPRVRNLFLHEVDHPMGYQDGVSGSSDRKMNRRALPLSDKDRRKLYEVVEYTLREIESSESDLSPEDKKNLLIGANQLSQSIRWNHWAGPAWYRSGFKCDSLRERISKSYVEDDSIERITEWDAQITENKSMWHMERVQGTVQGSILSPALSAFGSLIYNSITEEPKPSMEEFATYQIMAMCVSVLGIYMGEPIALALQDTSVQGSPNTSRKLIDGRHYNFIRHPLYTLKMALGATPGITSLNPVGLYCGLKTAYHLAKACDSQDERMRILHGKEAEEFQRRVPAHIPGANLLLRFMPDGLREKLEQISLSGLLEKVPMMRYKVDYMRDPDLWRNEMSYLKGEPNTRIGSELELKSEKAAPLLIGWSAIKANSKDLGEVFWPMMKAPYSLTKWAAPKIKKRWKQRQRRKAWEKRNNLERQLETEFI